MKKNNSLILLSFSLILSGLLAFSVAEAKNTKMTVSLVNSSSHPIKFEQKSANSESADIQHKVSGQSKGNKSKQFRVDPGTTAVVTLKYDPGTFKSDGGDEFVDYSVQACTKGNAQCKNSYKLKIIMASAAEIDNKYANMEVSLSSKTKKHILYGKVASAASGLKQAQTVTFTDASNDNSDKN